MFWAKYDAVMPTEA